MREARERKRGSDSSIARALVGASPALPTPSDASLSGAYAQWRKSRLGRITDDLERRRLFDLAGAVDGRRILDAGCGDGAFSAALSSRGGGVIAADNDEDVARAARSAANSIDRPFTVICADARSLPFASGAFDLVFASTLLCLAADCRQILSELARVLAGGGKLIVGDLGRWSLWNLHLRIKGRFGHPTWRRAHFFTAKELRAELAAVSFVPGKVRSSIYFPPIALTARILAPIDNWAGRRFTFGAFFIAAGATKGAEFSFR